MNHSWRDRDLQRVVTTGREEHSLSVPDGSHAAVVQVHQESPRPHEREDVSLLHVLVRSTLNSRQSHADVAHARKDFGRHLILAEDFRQPAPGVGVHCQWSQNHAVDHRSRQK